MLCLDVYVDKFVLNEKFGESTINVVEIFIEFLVFNSDSGIELLKWDELSVTALLVIFCNKTL
jgi:hypothetical protein